MAAFSRGLKKINRYVDILKRISWQENFLKIYQKLLTVPKHHSSQEDQGVSRSISENNKNNQQLVYIISELCYL